jgi:hypothetical protein
MLANQGSGESQVGKNISSNVRPMSALPPKADIVQHGGNVRFVPKADKVRCNTRPLLDHLVGAGERSA